MKKGYTLVELLAVFVLIAILSTFALTLITKYSNKFKNISNTKIQDTIISSAKSYVNNNIGMKKSIKNGQKQSVSYSTLVSAGYLTDNLLDVKNYKNKNTSDICVCVEYKEYNYIYTYQEQCNCN
jgi:prepilin-type N-terminal cleavage/methylation domain-containing protein